MNTTYLTISEVADKLKITRQHLLTLRKKGKFARPVIDSPLRWREKDIDNFFDKNTA